MHSDDLGLPQFKFIPIESDQQDQTHAPPARMSVGKQAGHIFIEYKESHDDFDQTRLNLDDRIAAIDQCVSKALDAQTIEEKEHHIFAAKKLAKEGLDFFWKISARSAKRKLKTIQSKLQDLHSEMHRETRNQFDDTIKNFEMAMQLASSKREKFNIKNNLSDAYIKKGDSLLRKGRNEEALEIYNKAAEMNSMNAILKLKDIYIGRINNPQASPTQKAEAKKALKSILDRGQNKAQPTLPEEFELLKAQFEYLDDKKAAKKELLALWNSLGRPENITHYLKDKGIIKPH